MYVALAQLDYLGQHQPDRGRHAPQVLFRAGWWIQRHYSIRATTSAGDVTFAATNGSSTITVTDTAHGAIVNDFVTFSDAAGLGGNITAAALNQEYQVVTVPSANTYTIAAKDTSGSTLTANASDTGNGGSSTVGAYQLTTGQLRGAPYWLGWWHLGSRHLGHWRHYHRKPSPVESS